jgi:transposase
MTIISVSLDSDICECGGHIALSPKPYIQRIDLPEIKPHVIEYQLEHGHCNKCKKRKSSKLPAIAGNDIFGPRAKSVISALTGFYKNSKREVENIMSDIFNLDISLGSISNSEARVSEVCKDHYETIEVQLSHETVLHIDETSHYNKGKLGWCWLFSSTKASLIKLADSRGKKILENSIFGSDDHIIVTDRYAAYNYPYRT